MLIKYTGKNKFIFIANTKCASSSIEASRIAKIADIELTNTNIGKHLSIGKLYDKFDFIFEQFNFQDFFKFGIIINLLDWVVSWFNFRSRSQVTNPNHPKHKNYTGEMTFAEFWNLSKNQPFLKPEYHKFFNKSKNIQVDYLMLQEKMLEDISTVKEILKIDSFKIPNKNKSAVKRISSEDVEDDIKEEIRQKYHRDYDLIYNLEEFNLKGIEH